MNAPYLNTGFIGNMREELRDTIFNTVKKESKRGTAPLSIHFPLPSGEGD